MEEQSSWKGHTFTLMIFSGIVALCSIFFILGMLVGRTQSQKAATAEAAPKPAPKDSAKDERPELTFFDAVDKNKQPSLAKPAAPPPAPAPVEKKAEEPPAPAAPVSGDSFQVAALAGQAQAEKLISELRKKGFPRAFILTPVPGDAKPVFRVQVGPIADPVEAESIRRKLVDAGYTPIKK